MTLEDIKEVRLETERFLKKLEIAKKKMEEPDYYIWSGTRETGAVKRAALDLKAELNKIK